MLCACGVVVDLYVRVVVVVIVVVDDLEVCVVVGVDAVTAIDVVEDFVAGNEEFVDVNEELAAVVGIDDVVVGIDDVVAGVVVVRAVTVVCVGVGVGFTCGSEAVVAVVVVGFVALVVAVFPGVVIVDVVSETQLRRRERHTLHRNAHGRIHAHTYAHTRTHVYTYTHTYTRKRTRVPRRAVNAPLTDVVATQKSACLVTSGNAAALTRTEAAHVEASLDGHRTRRPQRCAA